MTIRKKTLVALASALAVAAFIAVPFRASSQVQVDLNMGGGGGYHHHHRHHGFAYPEITAAINQLNAARNSLMNSAHDYAGHRAKALNAVNNAIRQCNFAIQYAQTHAR